MCCVSWKYVHSFIWCLLSCTILYIKMNDNGLIVSSNETVELMQYMYNLYYQISYMVHVSVRLFLSNATVANTIYILGQMFNISSITSIFRGNYWLMEDNIETIFCDKHSHLRTWTQGTGLLIVIVLEIQHGGCAELQYVEILPKNSPLCKG